jgi:hypothetical protein
MFASFFIAGFECSSHRRADGRRLDLLASSGHAELAMADYLRLPDFGIRAARDGLRWFLIETSPGRYDWSSFLPMLRAARDSRIQVVWDLCHYGWPDDIDIWSPAFVDRFARFAAAAARLVRDETDEAVWFCPVNEISFWAWAGGEVGQLNPVATGRSGDLKRQLVRASLAAMDAVRDAVPTARFLHSEPLIQVDGGPGPDEHRRAAEAYRLAQYEALDMLAGRLAPELGGGPDCLDVIGVNFYPHNQWYLNGSTIPLGHHAYRRLADMLAEVHSRYGRPMIIAETGAEGSARPSWLHYVMGEVSEAIERGVPLEGVCLYPILDCAGWTNDRLCPTGLLSAPGPDGTRTPYQPLALELLAQQQALAWQDRVRRRQPAGGVDADVTGLRLR